MTIAELPEASFEFKAEGFKLSTLPIDRASKYIAAIARLFGTPSLVHLTGASDGSLVLNLKAEPIAIPKVRRRLRDAKRLDGGRARSAFDILNEMLAEDGGSAVIQDLRQRATIIEFHGAKLLEDTYRPFWQDGEIRGKLVSLHGKDETKHGTVANAGGTERFECSDGMALQLRNHLFDFVSLVGRGRWQRRMDGEWKLLNFHVQSHRSLEGRGVAALSKKLKSIGGLGFGNDTHIFQKLAEDR